MRPSSWRAATLLTMLVCIVGVIYLTTTITTANGHLVAPLDDAYITFQYARQIAHGQPYRYNDGDLPTTGMTSPLFGFLLAGGYLLGLTGEHLPAFALGLGVIWLGLIAWLTYRLTARLIGRGESKWWPWVAAGLVVLTGSVQWGCFNGMETGFFTVLTLAALDAFLAERVELCALWLGLAGLTRPEGLILAGLIWGVSLVEGLVRFRTVRWRRLAFLSTAVLVGFVPSLVNWVLTGTTASAGLQAKSWFFNVPPYPDDIIHSILLSYQDIILRRFLGWESSKQWFIPPGLLLFSFLGWIGLGVRRCWTSLFVTVLWFLWGTLSTATLMTALWHHGRYQIPFVPIVIILAVCGLASFQRKLPRRWQSALWGLAFLLLALSAHSAQCFLNLYRRDVSTMVHQQLKIADWLRENLPLDARVGVHDTGSLRYFGERPTYDLIGLTTANATIPWRHGAGSVFELMEHSPRRPDYFAIYPDAFSVPYLAATDLFTEKLFCAEVPDYGVASAGPVQCVWRADWRLADSAVLYYQPDVQARTAGLTLMDTLDVADLNAEAAHNVKWWQEARIPGFPTEVQQFTYRVVPEREVLDGGRLLTGGIAFDVETRPDESLWLVARMHAQETGAVYVKANGIDVGRWAFPSLPGQWLETIFRVPAKTITGSQTRIVLQIDTDVPGFRHYAPYYFWFLQGEPENTQVEIEHRLDTNFGKSLSLLGFDLPEQVWCPGDVVPVTLYWQTTALTQSDAKIFLHLYDSAGNLGPQSDGWAFHGSRPPYTWSPGEIIVDPRELALPVDLPAGHYSVEVGLYNPGDSRRLPVYLNGIRRYEERVPLMVIEVQE